MRAKSFRAREALWGVDSRTEGQCGDRANAGHAGQPLTDWVLPTNLEDLAVQLCKARPQGGEGLEQWVDGGRQRRLIGRQFTHCWGKAAAGYPADLQAEDLESATDPCSRDGHRWLCLNAASLSSTARIPSPPSRVPESGVEAYHVSRRLNSCLGERLCCPRRPLRCVPAASLAASGSRTGAPDGPPAPA
jgi:hypothetical protein